MRHPSRSTGPPDSPKTLRANTLKLPLLHTAGMQAA